jgi:hypothetical protein
MNDATTGRPSVVAGRGEGLPHYDFFQYKWLLIFKPKEFVFAYSCVSFS